MSELLDTRRTIAPMSARAIARMGAFADALARLPQVPIATDHVLHGGLYARTITIPAEVVLAGALIRVPTLLIVHGHCTVSLGDEAREVCGYQVLAASRGRKQAFYAHADTTLTMVFATAAQTVAAAEDEFTSEAGLLVSRQPAAVNHVLITGE